MRRTVTDPERSGDVPLFTCTYPCASSRQPREGAGQRKQRPTGAGTRVDLYRCSPSRQYNPRWLRSGARVNDREPSPRERVRTVRLLQVCVRPHQDSRNPLRRKARSRKTSLSDKPNLSPERVHTPTTPTAGPASPGHSGRDQGYVLSRTHSCTRCCHPGA